MLRVSCWEPWSREEGRDRGVSVAGSSLGGGGGGGGGGSQWQPASQGCLVCSTALSNL